MSLADHPAESVPLADPTPTLFDLTARLWKAEAGVTALAVDGHALAVAFALADGAIALARAADPEPSEARVRVAGDSGQRLLLPRTGPFAPVATVRTGDGTPKPLAATATGFLTCDAAGGLVRLSPRGEMEPLVVPLAGRVTAIASDLRTGRIAATDGEEVIVLSGPRKAPVHLEIAGADVLSFSPGGDRLAAGGPDGLAIVDLAGGEPAFIACAGPRVLAWSPDGQTIALGHETPGLTLVDPADGTAHTVSAYPGAVSSIAFGGPHNVLATSGAYRAVAWSMAALPRGGDNRGALRAGPVGPAPVTAVALHPRRPILAAGRADGSIALAEIGSPAEMALCGPGGEVVTALAFFGEGDDLAIGFGRASLAIASLPAIMFK